MNDAIVQDTVKKKLPRRGIRVLAMGLGPPFTDHDLEGWSAALAMGGLDLHTVRMSSRDHEAWRNLQRARDRIVLEGVMSGPSFSGLSTTHGDIEIQEDADLPAGVLVGEYCRGKMRRMSALEMSAIARLAWNATMAYLKVAGVGDTFNEAQPREAAESVRRLEEHIRRGRSPVAASRLGRLGPEISLAGERMFEGVARTLIELEQEQE